MSVKCVVFDFNGTLFFDYQENLDAWNEISLKYRGRLFEDDEYLSMMGMTDRMCAKRIVPDATVERLDEISEEKERIYLSLCKERGLGIENDATLFIKECLKRGIKVMIASSAPKMNMDWYIANMGLLEYFEKDSIIAGRNDIPSKPAPDIYIYTYSLKGFKGEDCIAFEDAPGGLESALGAGFRKVYAIDSPGMDTARTGKMAQLVSWSWVVENIDKVLQ